MYDLVGNPKNRFSRVAAQITLKQKQGKTISCMLPYKVGQRMLKIKTCTNMNVIYIGHHIAVTSLKFLSPFKRPKNVEISKRCFIILIILF